MQLQHGINTQNLQHYHSNLYDDEEEEFSDEEDYEDEEEDLEDGYYDEDEEDDEFSHLKYSPDEIERLKRQFMSTQPADLQVTPSSTRAPPT